MFTYTKSPIAKLDYMLDWKAFLAGDVISSATWTAAPDDGSLINALVDHDEVSATIWLSGGILGQEYTVTCEIETVAGRIDERSFTLLIANK